MFAPTYLALLSVCASWVSSAAVLVNIPAFGITQLRILQLHGGNTTISFTVHDPNPLANATQTCTGRWTTNISNYPQGTYQQCGNSTLAWNMQSFVDISDFQLGVEHLFRDPKVGVYPYDMIINFGKAVVNESSCACSALGGFASCQQRTGKILHAPVYASVAKRKS
ncbi:hypothetical protein BAUCODRAFT_78224 [Baudoinia panamericana UAMH 10762]|uniref:AA1-like domain-containing protein n=1 Tax=Baudoinia panamericana (strain UAMH 10762) TaxID=717646 RepID=M2N045_BAUPA|nr:uncharacterized protein BAUCODRAFT_78224 [Baudoinia panamericana UAMH 10762]EMC92304.1 hypothetical protein BAUCODRAFT_78224 [Baudoinia panamericana UAMH 10762]